MPGSGRYMPSVSDLYGTDEIDVLLDEIRELEPPGPHDLQVSCLACLICLCSSGTVHVGLFMLPLAGRLRLMLCVTIFSLLVTCLFLFLDISHIVYLFPFNWGKLNAILYVSISVLFVIASSLVVHMVHAEAFAWVPRWSKDQLFVTGILGFVCSLESILISLVSKWYRVQYCPVESGTTERPLPNGELQLEEQRSQQRPPAVAPLRRPPPRPRHSSNNNSMNNSSWPIDDVQPCTSKSLLA